MFFFSWFVFLLCFQPSLYRPHFIRKILSGSDQIIKESDNTPIRKDFIRPSNIKIVREGMRRTVSAGSARSLNTLPVAVAGKTGTAQWSSKKNPHAWFSGFAPFDHPEIAFVVLIEEGGEGSSVSVPVMREYLDWYFKEYKQAS